jgi:hypothetical protein
MPPEAFAKVSANFFAIVYKYCTFVVCMYVCIIEWVRMHVCMYVCMYRLTVGRYVSVVPLSTIVPRPE